MKFFVTPPAETKWKMDPSVFLSILLARWPEARIERLITSEHFSFKWEVQMSVGELEGRFFADGRGVVLDAELEDCATVALWFRSLVPSEQELWFYDESYSAHIDLRPDTTAATVAAAFE